MNEVLMKASTAQSKPSTKAAAGRVVKAASRPSTRDLILKASRDLFNTEGFDGTSIAMICERVDIMSGNLTYYFPKKRDIVVALKESFDQEISDLQNGLLADLLVGLKVPSPAEAQRFLRSMLEIIWDNRFFFTSMLPLHRLDPKIMEAFRQVEQQVRMGFSQICQRGVNAEAIKPICYPNSPSVLADNMWYIMWGCMFSHKARDKDLEPAREVVINACLLQLGALIEPVVSSEFMAEYCKEVARGR